jgi:hypothetical protein
MTAIWQGRGTASIVDLFAYCLGEVVCPCCNFCCTNDKDDNNCDFQWDKSKMRCFSLLSQTTGRPCGNIPTLVVKRPRIHRRVSRDSYSIFRHLPQPMGRFVSLSSINLYSHTFPSSILSERCALLVPYLWRINRGLYFVAVFVPLRRFRAR